MIQSYTRVVTLPGQPRDTLIALTVQQGVSLMRPGGTLLAWIEPRSADTFVASFVGEEAVPDPRRGFRGRIPAQHIVPQQTMRDIGLKSRRPPRGRFARRRHRMGNALQMALLQIAGHGGVRDGARPRGSIRLL